MSFFEEVGKILKEVLDWVGGAIAWIGKEENQEQVEAIFKIILTVVNAVGVLNEPVPKRDRPKTVRTTLELLQKLSPTDLREIADMKELTGFDGMTEAELDLRVGMAIGGFVQQEKVKTRNGGRKPT